MVVVVVVGQLGRRKETREPIRREGEGEGGREHTHTHTHRSGGHSSYSASLERERERERESLSENIARRRRMCKEMKRW